MDQPKNFASKIIQGNHFNLSVLMYLFLYTCTVSFPKSKYKKIWNEICYHKKIMDTVMTVLLNESFTIVFAWQILWISKRMARDNSTSGNVEFLC